MAMRSPVSAANIISTNWKNVRSEERRVGKECKLEECINDLVVEMYDCGLVRTEELYMIAYGIEALTPDSPVFHITGISSDDDDAPVTSLPPVSTDAQRKIYERWTSYVNALLQLVEIRTSEDNKKAIIDGLMTYGRKNLLTLLYSPE